MEFVKVMWFVISIKYNMYDSMILNWWGLLHNMGFDVLRMLAMAMFVMSTENTVYELEFSIMLLFFSK